MHIHQLIIHNLLRISGLTIDAKGKHVIISGPNGSGKSSAVNVLWMVLGGMPAKDVSEPIHAGADHGYGRLDLGDYIVERKWTRGGTTLVVTAADGTRIRRPQELIDGLICKYMLDPSAFLRRSPREQLSDFLAVMGVKPPVKEVQAITGEEIPALPDETADAYLRRLIGERVGSFYIRRAELNRTVESKKQAHANAVIELENLGGHVTGAEMAEDVTELHAQLQTAYAAKGEHQNLVSAVQEAKRAVGHLEQQWKNELSTCEQKDARIKQIEQEIDRLKRECDNLRAEAEQSLIRGNGIAAQIIVAKEAAILAGSTLSAATPPDDVINILNSKITAATQRTELNSAKQQAANLCARMQTEWDNAKEQSEELGVLITEIREMGMGLLGGLDLGIKGLSVGDGELRLNNIPFVQASLAEKLRVACAIAMRNNPELKVIRVDEGECLDQSSRDALFEIADANGYQVFLTSVSNERDLSVEIVDEDAPVAADQKPAESAAEPAKPKRKKKAA